MTIQWSLYGVPQVEVTYHITVGTIRKTVTTQERYGGVDPDLDTPGDPIPEGPEEPTTDPITEDDPRVGHEPTEE